MGFLSRFEGKMEDTVEGAAGSLSRSPISPVQIAKKCEKQMVRSRMVGAGKQYAPTLYTVLVNPDDDERLFSFYPTLAGETETYLRAKAGEQGLYMDGQPLVRFIVDDGLRHGKFDVIAEVVASAIIGQLRQEEMERYGLTRRPQQPQQPQRQAQPARPAYNDPYEPSDPYASNDPYSAEAYDDYGASNDPFDPYAPPSQNAYADEYDDGYDDWEAPAAAAAGGAAVAAAGGAAAAAAGAAAVAPGATRIMPSPDQDAPAAAAAAAQAAPTAARLYDVTNNETHALAKPSILMGRATDCDIVIPDINASRHHAELMRQSHGVWVVRDLGSKNGTVINGRAIQEPTTLFEGDRLTMGLTDYKFTMA